MVRGNIENINKNRKLKIISTEEESSEFTRDNFLTNVSISIETIASIVAAELVRLKKVTMARSLSAEQAKKVSDYSRILMSIVRDRREANTDESLRRHLAALPDSELKRLAKEIQSTKKSA